MQNQYDKGAAEAAGFWVRLAAYLMDRVILLLPLFLVRLMVSSFSSKGILFHYTLADIAVYVLQAVYFILLTYITGTTLGKRLFHLQVVSAEEEKAELVTIIYRETIGRFLCGISMGIGYILVGLDREKRGIHDMLCDTRVVYAKKVKVYPVYQQPVQWNPAVKEVESRKEFINHENE